MRRGGLAILSIATGLYAPSALGAERPPLGPDTVPGNVIDLVGSSEALAPQLKDGSSVRTLKIGDLLGDWRVNALTASSLTLSRDGTVWVIGLNPDGTTGSSKPPAKSVVLILPDPTLLAEAQRTGIWDGNTPRTGLTLDETKSYVAFVVKAGGVGGSRDGYLKEVQVEALGDDTPAYLALNDKHLKAWKTHLGLSPPRFRSAIGAQSLPLDSPHGQTLMDQALR